MHPVNAPVSQVFGQKNQASGASFPHTGKDYACATGTHVVTIADGTVIYAGWDLPNNLADKYMMVRGRAGSGLHMLIQHDGWVELMAHLSAIHVGAGAKVRRGQHVANSGATGNTQGAHLHYEVLTTPCSASYPFGRYNPDLQIAHEDKVSVNQPKPVAHKLMKVTADAAMVRTSPRVESGNISPRYPHGIAKGATVAIKGYVQGQDPYPNDGVQDDAWL